MDRPSQQPISQRLCSSCLGLNAGLLALLLLLVGCGETPTPTAQIPAQAEATGDSKATAPATSNSPKAAASDARQLLLQVIDTYKQAKTYQDNAIWKIDAVVDGEVIPGQIIQIATKFQQPNLVRVDFRAPEVELAVTYDGKNITAKFIKASQPELMQQYLVRPLPTAQDQPCPLTVSALFSATMVNASAFRAGDIRSAIHDWGVLVERLETGCLGLLLSSQPFADLFDERSQLKLLADAKLGDRNCQVIDAETPAGRRVLWIDRDSFELCVVEFPGGEIARRIDPTGSASQVTQVANFSNGTLNTAIAKESLALAPPAGARQVSFFVLPPQPLATQFYGRGPASPLTFVDKNGATYPSSMLAGKVQVITWFQQDHLSRAGLLQLNRVAKKYEKAPRVATLAVGVADAKIPSAVLEQLAHEKWKTGVPFVREVIGAGLHGLKVEQAPTTVVLDAQGRVQFYHVGFHLDLASDISSAVEEILKGGEPSKRILAAYQAERNAFEKMISQAAGDGSKVVPASAVEKK